MSSTRRSYATPRIECEVCKERVYSQEAVTYDGHSYHKGCMRCTHCNKTVGIKGLAMIDGNIYCKPHFKELFKQTGGSYDAILANSPNKKAKQTVYADDEASLEMEVGESPDRNMAAATDRNNQSISNIPWAKLSKLKQEVAEGSANGGDDDEDITSSRTYGKDNKSTTPKYGNSTTATTKSSTVKSATSSNTSWMKKKATTEDDEIEDPPMKKIVEQQEAPPIPKSSSSRRGMSAWKQKSASNATATSNSGSNMPSWKQKALAAKRKASSTQPTPPSASSSARRAQSQKEDEKKVDTAAVTATTGQPSYLITGSVPKAKKMSDDSLQAAEPLVKSNPEEKEEPAVNITSHGQGSVPVAVAAASRTPEDVNLRSIPKHSEGTVESAVTEEHYTTTSEDEGSFASSSASDHEEFLAEDFEKKKDTNDDSFDEVEYVEEVVEYESTDMISLDDDLKDAVSEGLNSPKKGVQQQPKPEAEAKKPQPPPPPLAKTQNVSSSTPDNASGKPSGNKSMKSQNNKSSTEAAEVAATPPTETTITATSDSWAPVSTENLPLRHSAAQQAARDPPPVEASNPALSEEGNFSDICLPPENGDITINREESLQSGKPVLVPYHDNNLRTTNRSDSYDNMDTWMIPHRHADDSSWVNPIREIDADRKKELTDGIEAASTSDGLPRYLAAPGKNLRGSNNTADDQTVSTIGQFSVTQGDYADRTKVGSDVRSHEKITEQTWALPSKSTQEQRVIIEEERTSSKDYRFSYIAAPHTHSTASYSDAVREKYFPNQDNPIWEPKSKPIVSDTHKSSGELGLLATTIGEEDSWMPPDETAIILSVSADDEKVNKAAEDAIHPKSTVSIVTADYDWTPEGAEKVTRTKRIDFSGRVIDDSDRHSDDGDVEAARGIQARSSGDDGENSWTPKSTPRPSRSAQTTVWYQDEQKDQAQGRSRNEENSWGREDGPDNLPPLRSRPREGARSAQQVQSIERENQKVSDAPVKSQNNDEDDDDDDTSSSSSSFVHEDDEDSSDDSYEAQRDSFRSAQNDSSAEMKRYRESKQGSQYNVKSKTYDEEAPRSPVQNRARAPSDDSFATSASGRIRFSLQPETIIINSDREAEHGPKKRPKRGGMPRDKYWGRVWWCLFAVVLLLGGAGAAIYFLVFDDTEEPPLVEASGGPGNVTPAPTPSPASNPKPPSAVDKPIDGQPKPPTIAIPPTRAPVVLQPTDDSLLNFLSAASSDGGAALLDLNSPQYAAMQWIRTPNNNGIFNDQIFLQRYALATIYYSANGVGWLSSDGWLTDSTECEWYSKSQDPTSICNSEGLLVELDLSSNNLIGDLPPEIAFLSDSLGKSQLVVLVCLYFFFLCFVSNNSELVCATQRS